MKRRDFFNFTVAAGSAVISTPAFAKTTLNHQVVDLKAIFVKFCPGTPFLRQDLYTLYNNNHNHPIIKAYRDGVAAMKVLANNNANSWNYQANIHGFLSGTFTGAQPSIFSTCEHGTDYFLPWHRMYVYFFERIVRQKSGLASFALPYWNYDPAGKAAIPPPFRDSASALYDSTRNSTLNAGGGLSASARSAATALSKFQLLGGGQFSNILESTPHGSVHVAVGGNMGTFPTAGHDPIFWMHHCNIDRLWEKWLSQGGGRTNPTANSAWMNKQSTFADAGGAFVTMKNSDILATVNNLNYQYEDPHVCIPLIIATLPVRPIFQARKINVGNTVKTAETVLVATKIKPDLTQDRLTISAANDGANSAIRKMMRPFGSEESIATGRHLILEFSGVKSDEQVGGYYEVYLNLPEGGKATIESPYYVGNLITFGADMNSRMTKHGGSDHNIDGLTLRIDITDKTTAMMAGASDAVPKITIVRAGVEDANGKVADFNKNAGLEIGNVALKSE